jgi:hypothetical protein
VHRQTRRGVCLQQFNSCTLIDQGQLH